jgi:hypothetical protein
MNDTVHVFTGEFETHESACAYTQEQWEDEPEADATDEEYAAWEERNPTWLMKDDLGVYLDSDFIETIFGDGRYEYLGEMLAEPDTLQTIRSIAREQCNTLVLIFSTALGGFDAEMKSTSKLQYCGQFACRL